MKQNIFVDMDDVMIDFLPTWVDWINHLYFNINVDYNDIFCWDITKAFPTLTKKEIYAPIITERFWKDVPPKKDAFKYLKKLVEDSERFDVYVVTATDYRNFKYKMDNIMNKHFPFISQNNVITCHKKQLLKGRFIIDDNVNNLIGGNAEPILFTAPHNKYLQEDLTNIKRVDNWEDCYNYIINSGV